MANTITTYNNIMTAVAREYNTIGTQYSEGTEGWNVRDMVAEVQHVLDVFLDPDSGEYEDAHDTPVIAGYRPWYEQYKNLVRRMRRFIEAHKDEAMTMECATEHSTIWG